MEDLFFPTCFFPNLHSGEPGGGDMITEQQGYVPADVLIKNMILSGQRLQAFRDEEFDVSSSNVSNDVTDLIDVPMRRLDFDLSEASMLQESLNLKFLKSRNEMEKNEKIDKKDSVNNEAEELKNPK